MSVRSDWLENAQKCNKEPLFKIWSEILWMFYFRFIWRFKKIHVIPRRLLDNPGELVNLKFMLYFNVKYFIFTILFCFAVLYSTGLRKTNF